MRTADYSALAALTQTPLVDSWIWSAPSSGSHLQRMDASLQKLQAAGFTEDELHETLKFLLGSREGDWLAGWGELLGLTWLAKESVLIRPGWNGTGAPTGSAAFDAEIAATCVPFSSLIRRMLGEHRPPKSLVLDIKPASNAGLKRLVAALETIANAWAAKRTPALRPVSVEVDYGGVLTQDSVGADLSQSGDPPSRLEDKFRQALNARTGSLPVETTLKMTNGAILDIRVSASAGVTSSAGFTFVSAKASDVRKLLHRHVTKKAEHAKPSKLNCPPFLLMYVAAYGYPGGDIDEFTLQEAARSLDEQLAAAAAPEGDRWLGVCFLDDTGSSQRFFAYLRPSSAKKYLQCPSRLARKMRAQLWPVRMQEAARPIKIKSGRRG